MNSPVSTNPNYELQPKVGRKAVIVLGIFLIIGILLLPAAFAKEASIYLALLVSVLIAVPTVFIVFLQRAKGSNYTLVQFIHSISDLIIHWAVVRAPLGEYNACCELSSGHFANFDQNLSYHSGYKAVLLSVSKFTTKPEAVSKAPFVRLWYDNYILKLTTILPFRDEEIESWKKSDEKWKRLVSEDEIIRAWMAQHCNWMNLRYAPPARGIYSIGMQAYHGYRRNPSVKDGWLKGKWLTTNFTF